MTSDEIKAQYTMRQIVERYGLIPNRAGFICCPFHNEDTPSMKIYKDSFYCFGCNASGDIFKFVEMIEGVDFKEAYKSLGGTYEYQDKTDRLRSKRKIREIKVKAERKSNNTESLKQDLLVYRNLMSAARVLADDCFPYQDDWCFYKECQFKYDVLVTELEEKLIQ